MITKYKIFENKEYFFVKKTEDTYQLFLNDNGVMVGELEIVENDPTQHFIYFRPENSFKFFNVDELSEIIERMKLIFETNKYNL